MEKINIAALLKDCPKGMELYSPLCGKCVFDRLNMGTIICKKQNTQDITFTSEGYYMLPVFENCECMIFPSKDQRDWSKFHRPFKNGDIVASNSGAWIGITTGGVKEELMPTYCVIKSDGTFDAYLDTKTGWYFSRLATKEEKQKLFKAIKDSGYTWNAETKTLEKLIKPKFKVGDKVRHKNNHGVVFTITSIEEDSYVCGAKAAFWFDDQDDYELVPNKFDVSTLVPFESRVLVRDKNTDEWRGHFFSHYDNNSDRPYICIGLEGINEYNQCIPYEENKYLLGKTDDCDEYYKTWE